MAENTAAAVNTTADKYAVVRDPNYTFRGNRLGRGQIVRLTEAQLEATKDHKPPRLVETSAPKEGDVTVSVVDIRPVAVKAEAETGEPPARPALKHT